MALSVRCPGKTSPGSRAKNYASTGELATVRVVFGSVVIFFTNQCCFVSFPGYISLRDLTRLLASAILLLLCQVFGGTSACDALMQTLPDAIFAIGDSVHSLAAWCFRAQLSLPMRTVHIAKAKDHPSRVHQNREILASLTGALLMASSSSASSCLLRFLLCVMFPMLAPPGGFSSPLRQQ